LGSVKVILTRLPTLVLLFGEVHLLSVDESKEWSPSASLSRNSTSKENKNLANRETSSLEKTSPYGILKWIIIGALLLVTAWMFGKDYLKRS